MEHINNITYINLNKRPDRRKLIETELDNFNLQYERFEAVEHIFGPLGCAKSHLEVIKNAKKKKLSNILILEDDFTFLVSQDEFVEQLNLFFNLKIDYDVLMLSYNLLESRETEYNFIGKMLKSYTMSGYLVNSKYFDTLINLWTHSNSLLESTGADWLYAIDAIIHNIQPIDKWYYFTKRIGKQIASFSNNANQYRDYNC